MNYFCAPSITDQTNLFIVMRKTTGTLLFLLLTLFSYSQSASVKGTVADSLENKNLQNSVISVLHTGDSVLVRFSRADANGNFSIAKLAPGQYIIMVTHPYMGDFFEPLEIKEPDQEVTLKKIYLTPKSKLLEEVIVRTGTPIRIKGDTTVYTADSFKVRPGANVEELLRRLPGISVDRDGKITAMGERVTKVLVDGEEFFGSDPGIATKNLRADAVQEIQVFDKKSDQAEFTGIDDGIRDKTINIKMKKNAGHFGKIELGGGLKDRYNNAAMANLFEGKRKIAAYGLMSNTGQTQLDWQDNQNYGGSAGMESGITEDGGVFITSSGSGEDSYWGGRNGIPQNWSGGLHYSNKFGRDDKQGINTGYRFNKVNAPGITRTYSKNFLPDTSWNSNSIADNYNSNIRHNLNLTVDLNLDSANSLKWTMQAGKRNTKSYSNLFSEALTVDADSINNNTRNNRKDAENNNVNTTLLWRHKFRKTARTLSMNTSFNWNESKSDGILYSLARYYENGLFNYADTLDQQNIQNSVNNGISTRIAYTEPLSKELFLEASYSFSYTTNTNELITNHKTNDGKYEDFIDSLSLSFQFNRIIHTPGLSFRLNKPKYNITVGSSAGFSRFIQENNSTGLKTNYNFVNLFPRVSFQYKIKPNEQFRINYNGSTTAPTVNQLQPIRINTDPLNEYVGNPDLEQSFRHTVDASYSFYNILKERGLWSYISANYTDNAFVQASTVDASGKRTYQTVNASGAYNINLGSSYNFKVTKHKIGLGLGPTASMNRRIDFVNGVKNLTTTSGYGLGFSIDKRIENKFEVQAQPSFTWNKSEATVNSNANAKYWQFQGWLEGRVYLSKSFDIASSVETEIRQKDPRFTQNNNFTKWNAFLTKRFLADNKLEAKFGVYDILNQNRGFSRNFNSYSFTETFYNTLKRYWLLTLTWNFSKNGKPASW